MNIEAPVVHKTKSKAEMDNNLTLNTPETLNFEKDQIQDSKDEIKRHCKNVSDSLDFKADSTNIKIINDAISLGNLHRVEKIICQWQEKFSKQKIFKIISRAYCELKLNNVFMSLEMELLIQEKLISLNWPSVNAAEAYILQRSDIEARIQLLLSKINFIQEISNKETKFLYITESIAKNIYVLKQSLKSTYAFVPWEESLFCLVIFVSAHKRINDLNIFYRSVLTKKILLNHLREFGSALEKLQLPSDGLNVALRIGRQKVVAGILAVQPAFSTLYKDYTQVRDIHSLDKMKLYADAALEANCSSVRGQLTIKRSLQVLGEHLKDTLESPNLSADICELLLQSAPQETRQLLTATRNSLSHQHILMATPEVYRNVQNDIKKIYIVISRLLYSRKMEKIKLTLNTIAYTNNNDEILERLNAMKDLHVLKNPVKLTIDQMTTEQLKIQNLLAEIDTYIPNKTENELNLYAQINKIIFQYKDIDSTLYQYNIGLRMLKVFSDYYLQKIDHHIIESNQITQLKASAETILDKLSPKNLDDQCSYTVVHDLIKLLLKLYDSVATRISEEIKTVLADSIMAIYHVFIFEKNKIHWIDEFKEQLITNKPKKQNAEEKIIRTKNIKKVKATNIIPLAEIGRESPLFQKLRELKNVFNLQIAKPDFFHMSFGEKIMIESLLLDILSDLDSCLIGNVLFVEADAILLTGKCLRNYLAHGNPLVEAFSSDPFISVYIMAQYLTKNVINYNINLGTVFLHDVEESREKFKHDLDLIDKQEKICRALLQGQGKELEMIQSQGINTHLRKIDCQTMLHMAAQGGNLEVVKLLVLGKKVGTSVKDIYGQTALHIAAAHGKTDIIKFLVKQAGYFIQQTDNYNQTALFHAAKNGWEESVQELISLGAECTVRECYGSQPFHYAASNNHVEVIKVLLKDKRVDINIWQSDGLTALHLAAEYGHKDLVEFLIDNGANVNQECFDGETPLHFATSNGHLDVVNSLVKRGAEVDSKNFQTGHTPLHKTLYADLKSSSMEIVKTLLQNGAYVDEKDIQHKQTPLHSASFLGFTEIANILLDYGADVNAVRYNLMTPLLCATFRGHLEVVKLLYRRGARLDVTDAGNLTALHYAALRGHCDVLIYLIDKKVEIDSKNENLLTPLHLAARYGKSEQVVSYLIKAGANINCLTNNGFTPLHYSASEGNVKITEILIEMGANINVENYKKMTPLNIAMDQPSSEEIIKLLIRNGADVNTRNQNSLTPLHRACFNGCEKNVKCLIAKKADVNAFSGLKFTPLIIAAESNYIEIVKVLLDNGADINAVQQDGMSALSCAAKYNFKELAEMLLARGADINGKVDEGRPIILAVTAGNRTITELLLRNKDIQLHATDRGATLLHLAARNGNWNIAKLLIKKGIEIDSLDDLGKTPLAIAVFQNNKEFVDVLLAAGVDVVSKNQNLLVHAIVSRYSNIVESLLAAGASNERHVDKLNRSPLELAIIEGSLEMVEMFFKLKEINIEDEDESENTMLHIASHQGHIEVVKLLLKNGASIEKRNIGGLTALHIAVNQGHLKLIDFFIENGTYTVNDVDVNGVTVLHYAAHVGQADITQFLINRGANVNAVNSNLLMPIHLAAKQGHLEIINALLSNGAVYNDVDVYGQKPCDYTQNEKISELFQSLDKLFQAVELNDGKNVENLVSKGITVNSKRADNQTLFQIATKNGYEQICNILLKNKSNKSLLQAET